ncbi:MAG: hypothetical protein NTW99_01575 [Chloroflexi bacterium]|nr:hypothetical protein [Chloroflexota bacterium]
MKLIAKLKLTLLLLALLSLEACRVLPSAQGSPTPPSVLAPPTGTATLRATKMPTATPTQVVLSEEVRLSLLQTHLVVVMIEFDAEATSENAEQIVAGNVAPSDVEQTVFFFSGQADGTEWIIPFVTPPARLQSQWGASQWEAALAVHRHTRELLERWANGSTDAAQVLQDIRDDLTSISQTVGEVEGILAGEYGMDMQSLIEDREEALAGIRDPLEATATPP